MKVCSFKMKKFCEDFVKIVDIFPKECIMNMIFFREYHFIFIILQFFSINIQNKK